MDQPAPKQGETPAIDKHHELRTAENSVGYLLTRLRSLPSDRPISLLDVGAGPGTITVSLARALPNVRITATDVNPEILVRARSVADAAGVQDRVDFRAADVYSLPFPDGAFDVTHCHQVLCHLGDRSGALREMLRVTKAGGGMVAAREGDLETEAVWPPSPGLSKFHKLQVDSIESYGGCATGGRRLLSWALGAGVARDRITLGYGTWCYTERNEREVFAQAMASRAREGKWRDIGLESGLATEADLEDMAKAWDEWKEEEDAVHGMMHGEIIIQK